MYLIQYTTESLILVSILHIKVCSHVLGRTAAYVKEEPWDNNVSALSLHDEEHWSHCLTEGKNK